MSDPAAEPAISSAENPFPVVAEVRLSGDFSTVRIETEAVREVRAFADAFLAMPFEPPLDARETGRTLAVIGELGTGKSHLAAELIERLHEHGDRAVVLTLHVDVGDTLLPLYRKLFHGTRRIIEDGGGPPDSGDAVGGALLRNIVRRQLDELHADVCAQLEEGAPPRLVEEPHGNAVTLRLARGTGLRDSGLTDAELTQLLRDQLDRIVGDRECANALSLLLHSRDEYAEAAWLWLQGRPVSDVQRQVLTDRGVIGTIADDTRAGQVLSALSFLFARTGKRLVLVIDEVQHLWRGAPHPPSEVATILNPLLSMTRGTGALLVLCGLADFWDSLPDSTHSRTGTTVKPSPFTDEDLRVYIRQSQLRKNGKETLSPFEAARPPGRDPVELIRDATRGNPRQTIELCHHAFRRAAGGRVTEEVIHKASNDVSVKQTVDDVEANLVQRCRRLGHPSFLKQSVGPSPGAVADIWIPVGAEGAGYAIVLADSVLDLKTASALVARARAVQTGPDGRARTSDRFVTLVVVGLMAESISADLSNHFSQVLVWNKDTSVKTAEDLTSSLEGFLPAQQANVEAALLRQLQADVRDLAAARAEDRQFFEQIAALIRETRGEVRQPRPGAKGVIDFGPSDAEQELTRRFAEPLEMIEQALQRAADLWEAMFRPGSSVPVVGRMDAAGGRDALPQDLTDHDLRRSMDAMLALQQALRGFGRGVVEMRRLEAQSGISRRKELRYKCDRFDDVIERLLSQLPSLSEVSSRTVQRIMDIDQPMLARKVRRLGAVVFDTLHADEFRRR